MQLRNNQCIFPYGMVLDPTDDRYEMSISSNESALNPNQLVFEGGKCLSVKTNNPYFIYDFEAPTSLMMLQIKICSSLDNLKSYTVDYYIDTNWIQLGMSIQRFFFGNENVTGLII